MRSADASFTSARSEMWIGTPPGAARHHNPHEVCHLGRQGLTTNVQLLALMLNVAAAGDGIVPFECLKHVWAG